MKYTIGYIEHDSAVHDKWLGPGIESLNGEFETLTTSDTKFPAENYNDLIARCSSEFLVLTHQDVTIPKNLLTTLDATIARVPNFGTLGMVGVDTSQNYRWSSSETIFEVDTLDCCFVIIRPSCSARFDTVNFGEYHLYVEDYCAQTRRTHKLKNYTILCDSHDGERGKGPPDTLAHYSATVRERGSCWGDWGKYRMKLTDKWGRGIRTT